MCLLTRFAAAAGIEVFMVSAAVAQIGSKRADIDPSKFPSYVHPAVIAHSQTGCPVLFINRSWCTQ